MYFKKQIIPSNNRNVKFTRTTHKQDRQCTTIVPVEEQ